MCGRGRFPEQGLHGPGKLGRLPPGGRGPREPKETTNGFRDYIKAPELPAVIDTGATLTTRYKVTSMSTLVVVDAKGDVTFRATDPSAEKIQEELTKAGAQ